MTTSVTVTPANHQVRVTQTFGTDYHQDNINVTVINTTVYVMKPNAKPLSLTISKGYDLVVEEVDAEET